LIKKPHTEALLES